jgi:hypothetical protein
MTDNAARKIELTAAIQELRNQESEARQALKRVQEPLNRCREELAVLCCPYKVGQRVREVRKRRDRPIVLEVSKIVATSYRDDAWEIYARQVKKDGTLGVRESRVWQDVEAVSEEKTA